MRGGHSGCDIQEGRANSIKLLVRTLLRVPATSLQLFEISGGSKRNAIPREAAAIVVGPVGTLEALKTASADVASEAQAESCEPDVTVRVEREPDAPQPTCISPNDTERILQALTAIPSGVLGMHPKVSALVETSNNVSTMTTKIRESQIAIAAGMLSSSPSDSRKRETFDQLAAIGRLAGAKVALGRQSPGW